MREIIRIDNISFSYPSTKRKIIDNCSFQLHEGELLTILGPNGAGKSTLLNCACDLLSPQNGEVRVDGTPIRKMQRKDIAKYIGYVQQQQTAVFSYTVFDYILMGRAATVGDFSKPGNQDCEVVESIMETMGLYNLKNSLITEISGGERQQAAIARAIAQNPKAIFFDEPTAHLDYGNQIKTLELIGRLRDKGFAIVMTTHNPDHCLMLNSNVAILDRTGRLEVGPCKSIVTEERLRKVYNAELKIIYVGDVNRNVCIPTCNFIPFTMQTDQTDKGA